jgi:hypothetical protein
MRSEVDTLYTTSRIGVAGCSTGEAAGVGDAATKAATMTSAIIGYSGTECAHSTRSKAGADPSFRATTNATF